MTDSDESDSERILQDLDSPYAKRQCFHQDDEIYEWSTEEWSGEFELLEGTTDEIGLELVYSLITTAPTIGNFSPILGSQSQKTETVKSRNRFWVPPQKNPSNQTKTTVKNKKTPRLFA